MLYKKSNFQSERTFETPCTSFKMIFFAMKYDFCIIKIPHLRQLGISLGSLYFKKFVS